MKVLWAIISGTVTLAAFGTGHFLLSFLALCCVAFWCVDIYENA